jgi:phage host-nuclease inhibitor protein Gam
MVKTREKKVVVAGITRETFEAAFADYAAADAKVQNTTAKMDMEITRTREKYQDEIVRLLGVKALAFDVMQVFAVENKDEMFSKRKSVETVHGVVGFRTGTPKLKLLKGFTWNAVTNLLKEFLPDFVRITEETAKDMLLASRDKEDVAKLFPKVGICIAQDETFFVEPKKELPEA